MILIIWGRGAFQKIATYIKKDMLSTVKEDQYKNNYRLKIAV
jgi:hypothetical protein